MAPPGRFGVAETMPALTYASKSAGTRPRLHRLGAIQAVSNHLARKSLTLRSHRFGLIFRKISKALFEMGIWQFESYMVSQSVQSPLCDFRVRESRGHSRGLGWRARVSGRQI